MPHKCVTLTVNPSVDVSFHVDRMATERKLEAEDPMYDPGGGGINVARGVSELGGDPLALWARGGPVGRLLGDLLDGEGVDHEPFDVSGLTRQNLAVYEESTGDQYRFGLPGPRLAVKDIDGLLDRVRRLEPKPDLLVLSGSLPPKTPDDLYALVCVEVGREARTVVDTRGPALAAVLDHGVFLVKPNRRELSGLVGRRLEEESDVEAAARQLVDSDQADVVVASLGADGALLVTDDEAVRIHAPEVDERSRVGAGDSMVAGIVHRLDQGDDVRRAVEFGVATGSAATLSRGTRLFRRSDAEALASRVSATAGSA